MLWLVYCTTFSRFPNSVHILDILDHADKNVTLLSISVQNKFQILPVKDNWENGIRKEFKPFSSEIFASQVSRVLVTSFRLL